MAENNVNNMELKITKQSSNTMSKETIPCNQNNIAQHISSMHATYKKSELS